MRIIRWMTALCVVSLSAVSVAWGVQAMHFGRAHAHIIADEADGDRALPWAGVPGLTTEALEMSLQYPAKYSEARQFLDATRVLAVEPTSSPTWLSLAETRLDLGLEPSAVKQALAMSWVTGQNEGDTMWSRGVFAASLWDRLSLDEQRKAIADLSGLLVIRAIGDEQINFAKAVFTRLPEKAKGEIGDALERAGGSEAQILALGLTAP